MRIRSTWSRALLCPWMYLVPAACPIDPASPGGPPPDTSGSAQLQRQRRTCRVRSRSTSSDRPQTLGRPWRPPVVVRGSRGCAPRGVAAWPCPLLLSNLAQPRGPGVNQAPKPGKCGLHPLPGASPGCTGLGSAISPPAAWAARHNSATGEPTRNRSPPSDNQRFGFRLAHAYRGLWPGLQTRDARACPSPPWEPLAALRGCPIIA